MTSATALHQLFDSVGNWLSMEAASKLCELKVIDELQDQLDTWATQNSAGDLHADDRQQYEAILRALNFVAVLQAKARLIVSLVQPVQGSKSVDHSGWRVDSSVSSKSRYMVRKLLASILLPAARRNFGCWSVSKVKN